ncbi:MAG: energy transducer TonB [Proteobacteria bacterium]|nr:energy transducer TonB [Pseudomonadota bacterium]
MSIVNHKQVRAIAISWMLLGSAIIFLMLVLMNHFSERPEKDKTEYSAEFEVKKPKRTMPEKEKIKKKIKRQAKIVPPLMLDMNSDIAGLDLGLPAFALGDMGDDDLLGNTSDVVMTSDMVDTTARALSRSAAEYPRRAKAKDIEGYVVISLLIDKSGKVSTARVIESDPVGVFEEKALQTIKTWLFEPAKYKGKAVDSWANQTIRFELS